jgi:GntR family transcriptional regulator/MocR family aminotransferase
VNTHFDIMIEEQFILHLDDKDVDPLYRQIYLQLRRMILDGDLTPGTKLPPSRKMAKLCGIGRVTVTQAYKQLEIEGFVNSRPGAGTFVAEKLSHSRPAATQNVFNPDLSSWGKRLQDDPGSPRREKQRLDIDFGFGRSFPHIFPYDVWRRLLARYLSTDDVMLSRYGSPLGFYPLREALASYLIHQRGVNCTPEQVVIVSGAQQALDILARLLLNAGDKIVVETPGYNHAYRLFQAHGAKLHPLAVDEHGLPVDDLPQGDDVRAAFVTPSHQFPRGGSLRLDRRLKLLAWARHQGALILEDDYDSELRYDGRPLSALQGLDESGHVVYLGTFSKVLFPTLRLGYVVLPESLLMPFSRTLALVDRGAPTLTQAAVADFISEGHFERHLHRLRLAYGERRETLVTALDTELAGEVSFSRVPAGLHIMIHLHPDCDETRVIQKAAAAGVGIYPGAPYYLQEPTPPSILLGFSGLNKEQIQEGVSRLAAVLPRPASSIAG